MFFVFFFHVFLSFKVFRKLWTTLAQCFCGDKKSNGKTSAGQASGWACRTRAKFQGLSRKNGVDIWTFVRNK